MLLVQVCPSYVYELWQLDIGFWFAIGSRCKGLNVGFSSKRACERRATCMVCAAVVSFYVRQHIY